MTSPALQPWKTYLDALHPSERVVMAHDLRVFLQRMGLSLEITLPSREPQRRVHAQAR